MTDCSLHVPVSVKQIVDEAGAVCTSAWATTVACWPFAVPTPVICFRVGLVANSGSWMTETEYSPSPTAWFDAEYVYAVDVAAVARSCERHASARCTPASAT